MPGSTITMKQNDTSPSYLMEITTPGVSLVGATVVLLMRDPQNPTPLKIDRRDITGDIQKDQWDSVGGPEILLRWSNLGSDDDTEVVGTFEFEVEVTYSDGGVETFPNDAYNKLVIIDDLD